MRIDITPLKVGATQVAAQELEKAGVKHATRTQSSSLCAPRVTRGDWIGGEWRVHRWVAEARLVVFAKHSYRA